jgi:hypothetical protein
MNIIEKLNSVASSTISFTEFISSNNDDIFNFFINQSHLNFLKYREAYEEFLFNHFKAIKKLDLSNADNQIFIDVLIDACERLNLSFYFQRLCRIKQNSGLQLSKRNESTSLYLNGLRNLADFSNILDEFLNTLQSAFEVEEDTNKRVLAVFFNFYTNLIKSFGEAGKPIVESIKQKKKDYPFLLSDITDKILEISIIDGETAYTEIHSIIDAFLAREAIHLTYSEIDFLVELETEYAKKINEINAEIAEIRKLAARLYNGSDEIFYSLGRGVAILSVEQQLYAYFRSYGNMHFAKCNYAYSKLPLDFFSAKIEIIDYGCGQALASMTYLDYLKKQNISQHIERITLNEPSEIALRRGALHIRLYNKKIAISTINKTLNDLSPVDFKRNNFVKLHLFSNILDIDDYSIKHLTDLIKETFKGINYFVIVSPKITDLKTNRIYNFVKEFELKNPELIASENKDSGEWQCNWTLVLRLFKVNI